MEFKECILKRRSIRKFKKDEISDKQIEEILEMAINAPSSCNTQGWRFVVVREPSTKEKLSKVHSYCSFVKDAPVVIVVASDSTACTYKPSGILSVAAAIQNLLLSVTDKGLGSCWVYVKDYSEPEIEDNVRNILNMPDSLDVIAMLPIGVPDREPGPKTIKELDKIMKKEQWN